MPENKVTLTLSVWSLRLYDRDFTNNPMDVRFLLHMYSLVVIEAINGTCDARFGFLV